MSAAHPDPDAFANLLCEWCLDVHERDQVMIVTSPLAEPLVRALNRAIVIKQPVSPSDTYNFRNAKSRATKLLFPLDRRDYSLGGLYLFVGQSNFSGELAKHFSGEQRLSERDENVLQMLDELPTLDPFLLYALLKSKDVHVSEVYFQITEKDRRQIQSEMAGEFRPLVSLCFPNMGHESEKHLTDRSMRILDTI